MIPKVIFSILCLTIMISPIIILLIVAIIGRIVDMLSGPDCIDGRKEHCFHPIIKMVEIKHGSYENGQKEFEEVEYKRCCYCGKEVRVEHIMDLDFD